MRKILIVLLISLFFISPVYADNHVVNVSYDGEVTTASGTAPSLPLKARITFYDGSEKDYNIDWNTYDESLYKTRNASQFTVTGSISDLQLTTNCIVNVEAAKITHIDELSNKTVIIGSALSLPATASVTWSNGDHTNEVIKWDNYDGNALKYVHTFSLKGYVYNSTIIQTVHVKDASVTSVSVPAVVSTTAGVEAELPQYATVRYSNKTSKKVKIIWDNQVFNEPGKYTVYGKLSHSTHKVSIRVEVKKNEDNTQTPEQKQPVKKTKKKKKVQKEEKSSFSYVMALAVFMAFVFGFITLISFIKRKIRIQENR
ncbi:MULTISPECIES: Ig-like domain-containing protein [Catenibacterium]|jgi:thiol:disulfide interchange protein|uniref:Ig-like domain-containing protein n=2 Tax=Coprobacillaceae TaxID=2810280 RepID=UPI0006C0781D|nr:Ig-like domain-containing protein [Catenibacterium mitsuokai]CUP21744.1 Bacterial Ig-like domain (group 4) [Roseburia hominis]MCI6076856.1 Ig-like domain-containing protein [Catenibacterium mitsuokai]MDD6594523.1 Ig-like domain-containing protein [Catenibacterium mitsuokai]MEE0080843.1 Ig-like domain-containing protein [Catenibacterium mitsuokai]CUP34781.1 Bacterial Ig-like domain (group 4) [Catenibacterium mitsuokai]